MGQSLKRAEIRPPGLGHCLLNLNLLVLLLVLDFVDHDYDHEDEPAWAEFA